MSLIVFSILIDADATCTATCSGCAESGECSQSCSQHQCACSCDASGCIALCECSWEDPPGSHHYRGTSDWADCQSGNPGETPPVYPQTP